MELLGGDDALAFLASTGRPVSPLELLRTPFPASVVQHRPEVFCLACEAGSCVEHEQRSCVRCLQVVSDAHDCVPFVSHHEIKATLLAADPRYFVRPLAYGPDGLPVLDQYGGLWVELVVHDEDGTEVPRLGYGDAAGNHGAAGVATARSYALRSAAEEFGVGAELKQFRRSAKVPGQPGVPALADDDPLSPLVQTIRTLSGYANRLSNAEIAQHYAAVNAEHADPACRSINTATAQALMGYIAALSGGLVGQVEGGAAE